MKPLEHRIALLEFLGDLFRDLSSKVPLKYPRQSKQLQELLPLISTQNPWFTSDSVFQVILTWGQTLSQKAIRKWHSEYYFGERSLTSRVIMVIMAGNIPMVGFHDFLCTLLSGHRFLGKLSSRDNILFPLLRKWILEFDEEWNDYIEFTTDILPEAGVIIATGSNNTSRIIKQQFSGKPMIIRHNRNSIGLLSGNESREDLKEIAKDILWFYGLGCRNISLLYLPDGFDLFSFIQIIKNTKMIIPAPYKNNLSYQRAKAALHNTLYNDAGKLLFVESSELNSPLGLIHYIYYKSSNEIEQFRKIYAEQIQCTVGDPDHWDKVIEFGNSQKPGLSDYADGVDTLEFLINLS